MLTRTVSENVNVIVPALMFTLKDETLGGCMSLVKAPAIALARLITTADTPFTSCTTLLLIDINSFPLLVAIASSNVMALKSLFERATLTAVYSSPLSAMHGGAFPVTRHGCGLPLGQSPATNTAAVLVEVCSTYVAAGDALAELWSVN